MDVLSAAARAVEDAPGLLTRSSASRCSGVQSRMSGGETSCDAASAASGSSAIPDAESAAESADGTKNAPPMVRESRTAKSA